ncbi:hypothetical protein D3C73_1435420 [compost metagenome]
MKIKTFPYYPHVLRAFQIGIRHERQLSLVLRPRNKVALRDKRTRRHKEACCNEPFRDMLLALDILFIKVISEQCPDDEEYRVA